AAFLLAAAGTEVILAAPGDRLVEALDSEMDEILRAALDNMAIRTVLGGSLVPATEGGARLVYAGGEDALKSELVVAPDLRQPHTASLGLDVAGLTLGPHGSIQVDDRCRTTVPWLLAAGDVTGKVMVTAAA